MRKALITMMLAATVLSPVAAEAQSWRHEGRGPRNQNESSDSGRGDRGDRGGDRGGNREARSDPEPQVQQQQAQPQAQPQPTPQVARRHDGDGNRGDRGGNDNNRDDRRGGDDGNRGDRGGNDNRSIYPGAWQGDPNSPMLRHYQEVERRNQTRNDNDRGDHRRRDWRNDRNDRDGRNWRDNRDGRNWRNDWNHSWRNDRRYDWNGWRHRNRNIFHLGAYYSPYRSWSYRRFNVGFFLEPLFFNQRYWVGDPYYYRLPPAPPGTQWVRYYNDVVLVDVYSGEVIDVIYDFFW